MDGCDFFPVQKTFTPYNDFIFRMLRGQDVHSTKSSTSTELSIPDASENEDEYGKAIIHERKRLLDLLELVDNGESAQDSVQ